MVNPPHTIQKYRNSLIHSDKRRSRVDSKPTLHINRVVSEITVCSDSNGEVVGNMGVNTIRGVPILGVSVSNIIGEFALVKIHFSMVSGPLSQVLQGMFYRQAIGNNIVSGHHDSSLARVISVVNLPRHPMISPPQPRIINHRIPLINTSHVVGSELLNVRIIRPPNTSKKIKNKTRVLSIAGIPGIIPKLKKRVCVFRRSLE
mmetsp:Transcript_29120/g.45041  ORF Transcript_29120/g.45041 Transcript_29120/m.45041 type:complete len:203 (+) Transcript_29120:150-758(+)